MANDLIAETTILARLRAFEGYKYKNFRGPRYPYELPGVNLNQEPPKRNDCCTFVEGLIVAAWADAHPGFAWSDPQHGQLMVQDNAAPFSSTSALVEAGIATAVPNPDSPPAPWTVIQTWNSDWTRGHLLIVVTHHAATDRLLTLESTNGHGLHGVGFRNLGSLSDVDAGPPAEWWANENADTWASLCAACPNRQQARLHVVPGDWCRT